MTITLTQITGYLKQPRNWPRCALYFLFGNFFLQLALAFLPLLIGHVHAEGLTYHPKITTQSIALPKLQERVWLWRGAPPYKNERLADFQRQLYAKGVTNQNHLKLLVAMAMQENGALSEDRDGDHGCSIGLAQRNVCQYGYSAKSFRKKYPEWATYQKQLSWLAEDRAGTYKKFNGDIFRTIVHHNRPANALAGVDRCMNWKTHYLVTEAQCPVRTKTCSCYFRDEVSQHLSELELSSL